MITLKEVYEDTDIDLAVSKTQQNYVADITVMLARAYLFRNRNSHLYVICNDDVSVGMVLYYDYYDEPLYHIAALLVDKRFQRRGYGSAALKLVLDEMRNDKRFDRVYLFYNKKNTAADKLYKRFGFVETVQSETDVGVELVL